MKNIKLIALLLAFLMLIVFFAACNKDEIKESDNSPGSQLSERSRDREEDEDMETQLLPTDDPGQLQAAEPNQGQNSALPTNTFTALMPKIRIPIKKVTDNEYGTTAIYEAIESDAFNALYADAQESGFNIKATTDGLTFNAQNSDGYFIKIEVTDNATSVSVFNDIKHFD